MLSCPVAWAARFLLSITRVGGPTRRRRSCSAAAAPARFCTAAPSLLPSSMTTGLLLSSGAGTGSSTVAGVGAGAPELIVCGDDTGGALAAVFGAGRAGDAQD